MARRNPQSSSRAAPPNAYIQPRGAGVDPDESAFKQFIRTQVFAPEKREGNISLLVGLSMFAGGIIGVRLFGDALVVV